MISHYAIDGSENDEINNQLIVWLKDLSVFELRFDFRSTFGAMKYYICSGPSQLK